MSAFFGRYHGTGKVQRTPSGEPKSVWKAYDRILDEDSHCEHGVRTNAKTPCAKCRARGAK
ncbi:hypothetical protein [Streptosporangium sp. NPDC051022]|uniref:hypothetical protein n=1 Tax=Streptosporangium sp. NPDC051022 TaxID=3155752 RepID=UPI003427842E